MDVEFQAGTEGLRYAADKGLAVVIMESLRGGKLALDLPATRPLWESAPTRRTPAEWAFHWLWNQPEVTVTLSGMGTLEQVQQNIASAGKSGVGSLLNGELVLIDQARDAITAQSPIPCTACEYCLPCPNDVNIPRNFEIYNQAAMYEDIKGSRFAYKNYIREEQKASSCIQCEDCLSKCPQEINIPSWLAVVDEVLDLERPYMYSLVA